MRTSREQMKKHTPTPWRVDAWDGAWLGADSKYVDFNHQPTRDFILKACNAHDDLVAALKLARQTCEIENNDLAIIDAALAKAESAI